MASLFVNEQLPTTSEQAIRVFDERYLAGISAEQPQTWPSEFGDLIDVPAPRVTFPIGMLSTKYIETKEESGRFKTMQEKSFDLKVVEYDAGYEVPLIELFTNTFAYRKWQDVPSRFLIAEGNHVEDTLAALLESGTSATSPWDGVAFFHASGHKANPFDSSAGTFGNYNSAGLDPASVANIQAEITSMYGVLDENGRKMRIRPDTMFVPTAKYEAVKNLVGQQFVPNSGGTATQNNPYFNGLRVLPLPGLTDANDWYLVDSKLIRAMGVPPWVVAKYRVPETMGLRYFDESSDFFKNTSKIKVSSRIWYGFGLVFPHAIRRVAGA